MVRFKSFLQTTLELEVIPPTACSALRVSAFRYCGPRTGLRELLPIVNCGAIVNAVVLKNLAVVRSEDGRFGSLTRFGRCVPKPANALKLVAWVTARADQFGLSRLRTCCACEKTMREQKIIKPHLRLAPNHQCSGIIRILDEGNNILDESKARW